MLDPSIPDKGNVAQDTKAALAEFQKAGYTQQGGKLVDSSGKQVSMSIMMPSNYSDWVAGGKEVVHELGAIGIKASLDTPTATQYTSATQSGNYDVAFGGYGGTGWVDRDRQLSRKEALLLHEGVTVQRRGG